MFLPGFREPVPQSRVTLDANAIVPQTARLVEVQGASSTA
jgi:hypothetical protein